MSLALSLGICSPVNAISMQDEILTDNLESMMQVLEKETTNEYDYIVEIRDAKKNAKAIAKDIVLFGVEELKQQSLIIVNVIIKHNKKRW